MESQGKLEKSQLKVREFYVKNLADTLNYAISWKEKITWHTVCPNMIDNSLVCSVQLKRNMSL